MKLAQFSLLPMEALKEVAEHYGVGAKKYEKHNMRKGYEWSKSFDAAMRHLTQFWAGEDRDEETGSKHLAAVVFHALTLMEFMETHREYDDRYKPEARIDSLDVGSFGRRVDAAISEDMAKQAGKPLAHLLVHRDGRVTHNFDIGSAHVESIQAQASDTTQESYDAWDAGRPFGRFPSPIDAMPINRDKDKQ